MRGTKCELKSDIVVCAVEGNCVSGMLADPQPEEARFFSHVEYNSLGIVHCLTQSREKNGITFFPRRHPCGLSILEISDSDADAAWPSKLYCQLTPELVQRAQKEAKTNHLLELVQPAISALYPRLVVDQAHTVNQWIENMLPLFYPGYIGHLRSFLHYQESTRHRIYYCGDYLAQALVEGACHSGTRVAESISSHWASRHGS
jgi:oxygen-dependent protoporphyrinogen oxidase